MNNMFIVHGWVLDAIRIIFSVIDTIIYEFFALAVAVFYNVATAQLISGTIMHDFFSRIQLVIGIIVMFKVAASLFMGILNPDSISDKKNGFGGIIKRVIIVLIMIVLIVPLDIPGVDIDDISDTGQTSWNARMNASGIAFGTLYELQARLLKGNTIAKLILGVDGSQDKDEWVESGFESGQNLARIVFKSFFTIAKYEGDPICEASNNTKLKKAYDLYLDDDSSISQILGIVNYTCEDGEGGVESFLNWIDVFDLFDSGNFYAFSYSFLFSTVVGIFCIIVFISYTIDAAIRLIKLTILYLISPVPILSYIDPKTEKNFHNWLKIVGSTYIDLFIRLAIVYMIIFLIKEIDGSLFNGTNDFIAVEDGGVGVFSKIFIILGLLMFAREAPKFITETLGLQKNAGLFGGLASLMSGFSSTLQGYKANQDAIKNNPETQGNETKLSSRFKSLGAGLLNGADNMGRSYNDYTSAKEHKLRSALDRANQQNAIRRANAMSGVSFGTSLMEQARQDFTGDSRYDQLKRQKDQHERQVKAQEAALEQKKQAIKPQQEKLSSIEKAIAAAQDTVKKKGARTSFSGEVAFKDGHTRNVSYNGTLKDLDSIEEACKSTGKYIIGQDEHGNDIVLDYSAFSKLKAEATDYSATQYIQGTAQFGDGSLMANDEHRLLLDAAIDAAGGDTITVFKSQRTSLSDSVTTAQKDITATEQAIFDAKHEAVKINDKPVTGADGRTLTYDGIDAEIDRAEKALRGSDGRRGGKQG